MSTAGDPIWLTISTYFPLPEVALLSSSKFLLSISVGCSCVACPGAPVPLCILCHHCGHDHAFLPPQAPLLGFLDCLLKFWLEGVVGFSGAVLSSFEVDMSAPYPDVPW